MNGVSIAAGALAVFAIYRYSKSDSRGGSKDKDKGISKGRPSKVPIPPGCLPSPTGGPPVCPPREPTQNPPPSFNPFQPLQPPPPSPSDPFRPLQPPPPSPSDPSQPPPNPSNPDDGWRLNTSGYPQQAGCFIRRRYDANAADPWLPGTNGIIGRGWTPEMAPFATEPAACLLNETALKVARKYNNAGLSDEDLLVFSSGTNSSCLQWQSNPDKSDAGSITTIACQPFVPMGPAGHEYPQPQPPPPPSNASGFDYFLQQMIGSISQFSVLDPNDPYHPVYKSLGSQPVSGRSQLEQALKTCGLNPQCDFVELDGSADLWNCPGGWTPFGDGSACKKNTPSGQLQCTLWGNPTMDSCYPSGKPATKATLWGRTDPHYTLEQPKPASSPTWTFVKKGLGVEPPATVPPADTVVSGFFRWLNYDLPGETYAKAKAADEIACSHQQLFLSLAQL